MRLKLIIIVCISATILLLSFNTNSNDSPAEKIKKWYTERYTIFSSRLDSLQQAVEQNESSKTIRRKFLLARMEFKRLEALIEYYYDLDAINYNGPAIDFIEEEDPAAYHEPQGFQVIEAYLYPAYNISNKKLLLDFIGRLNSLAKGLSSNAAQFNPEDYALDAAMEELFRITTLGITGFDSPIGQLSLKEAAASLEGVEAIIKAYDTQIKKDGLADYEVTMRLIRSAKVQLNAARSFNDFDRMNFILKYMNPICRWVGNAKKKFGFEDNPARATVIKKVSDIFSHSSLQQNRYIGDDTATTERFQLGKALFYENSLSGNGKRSCATCHNPAKAFTDGLPKALQLDEHSILPRNTPTLLNAALQKNLFHDSRQASLDQLIIEVLSNEKEMGSGIDAVSKKLDRKKYGALYKAAYPSGDTAMHGRKIVNAISMYVRTLISYNSRFDQYMRGDKSKMTVDEIKGFNIFSGKAKCATCHFIPLFNGSKPPTFYYQESEVLGVPSLAVKKNAKVDPDPGRSPFTKRDFHQHAFKTPTVRNITLTAPYMHNGVFKTLEEVIDFYDKGGGAGIGIHLPNQTLPTDELKLSVIEKKQLIAFLKTLTDTGAIKY